MSEATEITEVQEDVSVTEETSSTKKRKKKQRTKKQKIRLAVIVSCCSVAVIAVGLIIATNLLYNFALTQDGLPAVIGQYSDQIMQNADGTVSDTNTFGGDQSIDYSQWLQDNETILSMESFDSLKLNAHLVTVDSSHKYVIACHGYGMDGVSMVTYSYKFYEKGFNLLLPDARGHGLSEGNYIGMGWHERFDIADWAEKIILQDPAAEIILYGVSMGGATVMMASGEKLPKNVKLVIEDCGYSSVWDVFSAQINSMFHLPTFPLLNLSSLLAEKCAGYSFKEASAVEQVKKSVTPTLFIHGKQDTFVPYACLDKVYSAANCEKQKLEVEGAAHGMSAFVSPELYWTTVFDFIDAHM